MEDKKNKSNSGNVRDFQLLDIQQMAVIITLYSDLISYNAVIEGKGLIRAKENNETTVNYNPDETALKSLYIYFLAKLMFTFNKWSRRYLC